MISLESEIISLNPFTGQVLGTSPQT